MSSEGCVYLVPTPVGNLGDITARALETLRAADLIACEDTRTSGRLLKYFDISKKLISYHEFNESSRARQLVDLVKQGQIIAVVTDAGSPGISDPAYRIVRASLDAGLEVQALPGPSALIPALTASGLPTDRFFFEGFLPVKDGQRRKRLDALKSFEHTLIFYESPHRIHKTLTAIRDVLGNRRVSLAREISKKFEEYLRGTAEEIANRISGKTVKGELVLVVEGNRGNLAEDISQGSDDA